MKRLLKGIFWGVVLFGNLFIIVLLATLFFNVYSVLWWLMDTTYAGLYIAGAGAILGISFVYSTKPSKNGISAYKLKENPRGVSAGRVLSLRVPALFRSVKGLEGKNGQQ